MHLCFPPTTNTPGLDAENTIKPAEAWAIEGTSKAFTADEVARFQRDGYAIVRGLADERLRREMLAATHDGLAREIGPVEYEAETHYPGAPASTEEAICHDGSSWIEKRWLPSLNT